MTYSLRRESDGAGDCGPMSTLIRLNPETNEVEYEHNARPKVGWTMQVGSPYGRSYSAQDYWHCTIITEIIEDEPGRVKFRTGNSVYEWKDPSELH